ncbi:hypothetical protein W04_0522 [Pseudoalteromonas sp. SW0106-04]|nr:hypothetical protein W04_0522 [Pseudoalteromonas sp. SW0106-04]
MSLSSGRSDDNQQYRASYRLPVVASHHVVGANVRSVNARCRFDVQGWDQHSLPVIAAQSLGVKEC